MTSYQMSDTDGVEAMCICIEFAAVFGSGVSYVRDNIEAQWARRYPNVEPPTKECTRTALKIMMSRELALIGGRPPRDITGQRNGVLKAIRATGFSNQHGRANWLCECQCEETYLNDAGDKVIIATREAFYHLNFNRDLVDTSFAENGRSEDGVEEAFILEAEIQEVVRSGQWVGDCFLYVSKSGRLNYSVGGQTMTLSHLDRKMYMLGYVGREDRVYLCDKQMNITSNIC